MADSGPAVPVFSLLHDACWSLSAVLPIVFEAEIETLLL
jgi:hypothetical protein